MPLPKVIDIAEWKLSKLQKRAYQDPFAPKAESVPAPLDLNSLIAKMSAENLFKKS